MPKVSKQQQEINNRELQSQIKLHMEEEGRNLYQSETLRRHHMSHGGRKLVGLGIILLLLYLASMTVIPYNALGLRLGTGLLSPESLANYRQEVILNFDYLISMGLGARWRIAGYLVVVLAGVAMASSGSVYQGVFQNPMASPTTLGVQAGGILGGLIYIWFFYDTSFDAENATQVGTGWVTAVSGSDLAERYMAQSVWERCATELWTLVGCFFGVMLIVGISTLVGRGKLNTVALMLSGSIFSTVINEAAKLAQYALTYNNPDDVRLVALNTLTGGSGLGNTRRFDEFLVMAVPIVACTVLLIAMSGKLNILVFGEEEAEAMGLPVRRFRIIMIVCCTILTAMVLSFCGQVAMLGFIIPHLARYLVGPDFKLLIPASALLGGVCTLLIYDVCYILGAQGSFNLYTSVVCVALSLLFILLYRRNRHADWS